MVSGAGVSTCFGAEKTCGAGPDVDGLAAERVVVAVESRRGPAVVQARETRCPGCWASSVPPRVAGPCMSTCPAPTRKPKVLATVRRSGTWTPPTGRRPSTSCPTPGPGAGAHPGTAGPAPGVGAGRRAQPVRPWQGLTAGSSLLLLTRLAVVSAVQSPSSLNVNRSMRVG